MNIFGITVTTTKHYNELVDRNRLQTKATAEAALQNDTLTNVKPDRKWSKGGE